MKINKILVPIDFSPCAINALKIAATLAKDHKASLEIINAIHMPQHPHADVMFAGSLIQPILSEYESDVEENFKQLEIDIPLLREVKYSTKKFVSVPTDAIYTCLEKDDIDLIVMGTKGSHDGLEKLVGSISADVIRFSSKPVLMIPENITSLQVETIGIAADLKRMHQMEKLQILATLANALGASVKILHIAKEDDTDHLIEEAHERINLKEIFKNVKTSYIWMSEMNIQEGIFDFIHSHQIDMLAMYPRHHNFWDRLVKGNTTKKVAHNIKIPLFTVHD